MPDKVLILEKLASLAAVLKVRNPTWADARNVYREIGREIDPTADRLAETLRETEALREAAADANQYGPVAALQRQVLALRKEIEDDAARRAAADQPVAQMTRLEFLEKQLGKLQTQAAAYEGRDGQAWARMSAQILTVRDALDAAKEGRKVEETEEQIEAGIVADLCTMGEAQTGRILRAVLEHRPDLWRRIGSPEPRIVQ